MTADNAGTPQLKQFLMVNIKTKFLREYTDQVISANKLDGDMKVRAPGPGLKQQASSAKQQASSIKQTRTSSGSAGLKRQATSTPIRVTSVKHQATSSKLLDS